MIENQKKMTMENGEDCCVKVAVHIRPLIPDEKLQGCKDCVSVPPGQPQVLHLSLSSFVFLFILFAVALCYKSFPPFPFFSSFLPFLYMITCSMIWGEKK